MKVLRACSGKKAHAVWTGTIKRLTHRYLEHRNRRRELRLGGAENKIVARYAKDVVGAMGPSES